METLTAPAASPATHSLPRLFERFALRGVFCVLLLGVAACEKRDQPAARADGSSSVGALVDDSVLTAKVKSALIADVGIAGSDVKVETHQGEVQLSGFVSSREQMERALQVARAIDGVTNVKNEMTVKPDAPNVASIGSKIDDTIVATKVKTALLADPEVRSLDIGVASKGGEVQLSGFVDNQKQLAKAAEIARSVEGVDKVTNQLSVKK